MFGLPRYARMLLILLLLVVVPSLYLLYPHHDVEIAPGTPTHEYQAGGIDSDHWRAPVKPDFELEEARWRGDEQGWEAVERKEMLVKGGEVAPGLVNEDVLGGGVIMPKLENATAKAELGRAAWKVLHLMTLRYPDNPTEDDRTALKSFFHLFSRLYPCGECAQEFQALLKEFPPQTSSRKVASLWLCHVHNQVNARLGKPEFDCLTLDATYDCGCGPEGASASASATAGAIASATESVKAVPMVGGKPLMIGKSPFDHLGIGEALAGVKVGDGGNSAEEERKEALDHVGIGAALAGLRVEDASMDEAGPDA